MKWLRWVNLQYGIQEIKNRTPKNTTEAFVEEIYPSVHRFLLLLYQGQQKVLKDHFPLAWKFSQETQLDSENR